jgi:hypothetical protein
MKKLLLGFSLFACLCFALIAQGDAPAPDASQTQQDTAEVKLKEVSVDKFENAGFWSAYISSDDGLAFSRLFEGSPAGKKQLEDEQKLGMDPKKSDKYVLGTRVDYYRRGTHDIYIVPNRPIPLAGITKTVSVWIVGRNYNHTLKLLVQDAFGTKFELTFGKLNFQGWKRLTTAIPPQNADGTSGIIQRNYHYNDRTGLKIVGFKVETDPMESYGSYYIYLDDLRVETDLYAEDHRDVDDMQDNW